MAIDKIPPSPVDQQDHVDWVSAPSPAQWRVVHLTDTPIQILAIYLFMTLVLPPFLLAINDTWPVYYRYESFSVIEGILVIGAIFSACLFRHARWAHMKEIAVTQRAIFIYSTQSLRIVGLLLAIVVAIYNFTNSGFRYNDSGLSEQGDYSLYFYAMIPACVKLLLIYQAFIHRGKSPVDRLERALITTALVVSINGNATAFITAFSFFILQTDAGDYLFKSKLAGASYLRLFAVVSAGIALVGLLGMAFIGAYIYGESVKTQASVDTVLDWLTLTWTPNVLIEVRSSNYASLVNTLPLTLDFEQYNFTNLAGVWNTFLFRLAALHILDFDVARASTMSVGRLNYEFITQAFAIRDREGTSPGLIPGFLYCFPPVLNLLMLGAYVFMVLGILQRLCLCMKEELSFIGKLILALFTLSLFESPIDFLIIIDDGFLFVSGLWWMSRLIEVRQVLPSASETAPDTERSIRQESASMRSITSSLGS